MSYQRAWAQAGSYGVIRSAGRYRKASGVRDRTVRLIADTHPHFADRCPANFHLRPRFDVHAQPSAVYLSPRNQTFVVWGLITGEVTHNTMLTKHSSAPGTRANSLNVTCSPSDAHEGAVTAIWAPDEASDSVRFVSGGADGRVKLWQLNFVPRSKGGKRSPAKDVESSITCLFTSEPATEPFVSRSEAVKRRQGASPDAITFVKFDPVLEVVCGITKDGDVKIWFDCFGSDPKMIRIDAGAEEELGRAEVCDLDVRKTEDGLIASVLVQHSGASGFTRFDVRSTATASDVKRTTYVNPLGRPLTTLQPYLQPSLPISLPRVAQDRPVEMISSSPGTNTPVEPMTKVSTPPPLVLPRSMAPPPQFGRFVVGGDDNGHACIWAWDASSSRKGDDEAIYPRRSWEAAPGKITAIDMACGLVAFAS